MFPDVESIKLCLSSGTDKNIVTVIPTDYQNEQGISLKPQCQAISQATVSVFVRDQDLEALKRVRCTAQVEGIADSYHWHLKARSKSNKYPPLL